MQQYISSKKWQTEEENEWTASNTANNIVGGDDLDKDADILDDQDRFEAQYNFR